MIRKLCYRSLTAGSLTTALLASLTLAAVSAPALAQPPLASAVNPAPSNRPLLDLICSTPLFTALLPICRPGVLNFQAQTYSADEGAGRIEVVVTRTGGSGGPISVDYRTANGTAVATSDYAFTSGTLRWAARDMTPRSFSVPVNEDAMFEPNETFTASLLNPTGRATIGQGTTTGRVLDNDPATIKLIGLNDFHGQLNPPGGTTRAPDPANPAMSVLLPTGGVEFLATQVAALKALNPSFSTVVGAGDLIGATPLASALFHDEPSILALDLLGLEFSSVGNHEFDDNAAELRRIQNGGCFPGGVVGVDTCIDGTFPGARFRYLAANVTDLSTGNSFFPGTAIKSFDIGGGENIKVGFIGLVLRNTPNIVTPAGVAGLSFQDEASTANSLVPGLRSAGAQAIVVLIHEGATTTGLLNDQSCPGLSGDVLPIVDALDSAIDVVVSGHTHQAYICRRNGRLLTSAGAQGRVVTDIDLTLARNGFDVIASTARNLPIVNNLLTNLLPAAYPTLAANPAQTTLVTRYNTLVAPLANRVVGSITADINRVATPAGESALGDVIADAQLDATSAPALGGALVAFMNPGGIRTDLLFAQISGGEAVGQVTFGESFTVQPFGNSLTTMTLTGAQIDTLLEQQFDNPTAGQMRILQVSRGFAYTWDAAMPVGSRVAAGSISIGGVPVDPAMNYRITVNSFLATGGDRFFVLNSGTNRLGGEIDVDAQTAFFAANSPVAPGLRNRITRLN